MFIKKQSKRRTEISFNKRIQKPDNRKRSNRLAKHLVSLERTLVINISILPRHIIRRHPSSFRAIKIRMAHESKKNQRSNPLAMRWPLPAAKGGAIPHERVSQQQIAFHLGFPISKRTPGGSSPAALPSPRVILQT